MYKKEIADNQNKAVKSNRAKAVILVVDDDLGHRAMLETLLDRWGFIVRSAKDGSDALEQVKSYPFDVVLMDIRMPGMDGITALKEIKAYNPSIPVVIMTAYSEVSSAIDAIKSGAYDYLLKPLDFDGLKLTLDRTLEHSSLKSENAKLKSQIKPDKSGIISSSPNMQALLEHLHTFAESEATILITGESGTGKELVARALHELSRRKDKPFITVNCAALSENLLESELFGHEKGSFTGADKARDGRFLTANKGTVFLDEIGEISLPLQAKLLRVIQQKEIQRIGSDQTLYVDVRIVTATNRDLLSEVKQARFREDLYYRLNVVTLTIPPLRDRVEDIPILAKHFLDFFADRNNKELKGFSPLTMDMLLKYTWPGNVRELENAIERASILTTTGYITERELPMAVTKDYNATELVSFSTDFDFRVALGQAVEHIKYPEQTDAINNFVSSKNNLAVDLGIELTSDNFGFKLVGNTLETIEREAILQTLSRTNDNKSEAAKVLGISRKTLHAKLKRYEQQ